MLRYKNLANNANAIKIQPINQFFNKSVSQSVI